MQDSSLELAAQDFRSIFEGVPGLYIVLTPELKIVTASDAFLRATMTQRDQIVGENLFSVFPDNPDDPANRGVASVRTALERVLKNRCQDAVAVQKFDIRRADGSGFEERYWSAIHSPLFDAKGRIRFIINRVEDVTEFVRLKQRDREQTQRSEELRTRGLQMEQEVFQRAQEIQAANRRLLELQQQLESKVRERTADLQRANEVLEREILERKRTEADLLRSEEQLRQSQKLEAIGRLSGAIAHDFNNLLSVILGYSSIAMARLREDDPTYAEMQAIERAGERAADLTRQLLAFSRKQVLDLRILDVNETLRGLDGLLKRVLGEGTEFRMVLSPRLGPVKADRGQVEQVIMNLIVNARDAMPDGGSVEIETRNVEIDPAFAREHLDVAAGSYVMLEVSDTGIGMDQATQARVFEPFFTTKARGQGTGLGLSTVFGIVKQSGGSIWLHSEPGSGTTFRLYFPRVEGEVEVSRAPPTPPVMRRGNETILLVEDDEQVRRLAMDILRGAGYEVLEARNPSEALRICAKHRVRIDLLLSDVILPKMSGVQLAARVTSLVPSLRVLFMSGYTDDVILHHGVLDSKAVFLQKPFSCESLTMKVREALDMPVARHA